MEPFPYSSTSIELIKYLILVTTPRSVILSMSCLYISASQDTDRSIRVYLCDILLDILHQSLWLLWQFLCIYYCCLFSRIYHFIGMATRGESAHTMFQSLFEVYNKSVDG